MPASGYEILKSAKLCAKIANLCAKIAKWVSGDVGVLGVLAVQRLLTRQKDLPDLKAGRRVPAQGTVAGTSRDDRDVLHPRERRGTGFA